MCCQNVGIALIFLFYFFHSIKVWDVASLVSEHTYSPAHVNPVTGVKKQPSSCHTFASTSLDGTALFWDIRQSKPATCKFHSLMNYLHTSFTMQRWHVFEQFTQVRVANGS